MWIIHYHGKNTGTKYALHEYTPEDVYNTINLIGVRYGLEFDGVEEIVQ